jgi:lysozyme
MRRWPKAVIVLCLGVCAAVLAQRCLRDDRDDPADTPGCVDGPTTTGIDVSYHQDTIQWAKVRKAGIRFAFIRVSDGTTFDDPRFAANWDGAKQAHILRGAYQYFRPDESATAQADLLIAAIARDRGELAPVIDVETTGGKTPAQIAAAIRTWVDRVRTRLGVDPIVYTSPEFWRERVGNADFSSQPLWLAHYTTECPRVPSPWLRWTFWQYSKNGKVPGIRGPVDLDVFAGSIDELLRR